MISDQTCLAERLMKIARSAAIMNGKFESNSNNYDESNLNRLHLHADELIDGIQDSQGGRGVPSIYTGVAVEGTLRFAHPTPLSGGGGRERTLQQRQD